MVQKPFLAMVAQIWFCGAMPAVSSSALMMPASNLRCIFSFAARGGPPPYIHVCMPAALEVVAHDSAVPLVEAHHRLHELFKDLAEG